MLMRGLVSAVFVLAVGSCNTKAEYGPVVIVGMDGAEWSVIEPLVKAGRLPNFAKLMARGSYGELETLEPILSPIIWTTIATGKGAEKHGITWFMERDPETGQGMPISSQMRKARALWNIASDKGKKVGVIGWWATWPAETVNGWVVSDHVAAHGFGLNAKNMKTEEGRTYPPPLIDDLAPFFVRPSQVTDAEVARYMKLSEAELKTRHGDELVFSNPLHHFVFALATNKTYESIARYTLGRLEPDLMMVYFEAIDSVSHLFMKYADPPLAGIPGDLHAKFKDVVPVMYERHDQLLGELVETAGPNATIIVASDHGFKTGGRRLKETENTDVKQAHLWHEKQGVLIMAGPRIVPGRRLAARVLDITPTVLYLLGIPVGRDMDGRIISEAIDARFLATHPPKAVDSYEKPRAIEAGLSVKREPAQAANVDPGLIERLQALGYMSGDVTPEVQINKARIALDAKDRKTARAALDELLLASPKHADGLILMAQVEEEEGRFKEAETLYARVASPDLAKMELAKRRRAAAMLEIGRAEEGEALLRELLLSKPADPELRYHLGIALERQDKRAEALRVYEEIAAVHPQHAFALNNAGNCAVKLNRPADARRYFERAMKASPTHVESRFNLGVLLAAEGKTASAKNLLLEALRINPAFQPALWTLAVTAAEKNELAEAEHWLTQFCAAAPKNPRAWSLRARVAAGMGQKPAAQRYLEQARALDQAAADEALSRDPKLRSLVAAVRPD